MVRPSSALRTRLLAAAVLSLLLTAGCEAGNGSHPGAESTESGTIDGDYQPIEDLCGDVDVDDLASLLSGTTFDQSHLSTGDDPDDAWIQVPDEDLAGFQATHCRLRTLQDTGVLAHWYVLVYRTPEEARAAFDTNPPSAPSAPPGIDRWEVHGWQQSLLQTYPDPSIEDWAAGSMFGHDSNLILMVDVSQCFMRSGAGPTEQIEPCDDEELTDFITEVGEQTRQSLTG